MEKFFSFINKLTDLIILNFLFVLTCIPVITIGASLTALYRTLLPLAENTESYIARQYLREWRKNFRTSTLIWVPALVVLCLCCFNLLVLPAMPGSLYRTLMFAVQLLILFLLYGILLYASALPDHCRGSVRAALRNALLLMFRFLPVTLLCLCINAIPLSLMVLVPKISGWVLSILTVIGFSLAAYAHAFLLLRVFRKTKLMPPAFFS